eukprot:2543691-Rhodomonas_salina.1
MGEERVDRMGEERAESRTGAEERRESTEHRQERGERGEQGAEEEREREREGGAPRSSMRRTACMRSVSLAGGSWPPHRHC